MFNTNIITRLLKDISKSINSLDLDTGIIKDLKSEIFMINTILSGKEPDFGQIYDCILTIKEYIYETPHLAVIKNSYFSKIENVLKNMQPL